MSTKPLIWLTSFLILIAIAWKTHNFLVIDTCLDGGDVWDYNENRCRQDCLTWTKAKGCIVMDANYLAVFMKCAQKSSECDKFEERKQYMQLCEKYNAPVNVDTGLCDFEFTEDNCFKLKGNWEYPDSCN